LWIFLVHCNLSRFAWAKPSEIVALCFIVMAATCIVIMDGEKKKNLQRTRNLYTVFSVSCIITCTAWHRCFRLTLQWCCMLSYENNTSRVKSLFRNSQIYSSKSSFTSDRQWNVPFPPTLFSLEFEWFNARWT
jgi:hypothetical protein